MSWQPLYETFDEHENSDLAKMRISFFLVISTKCDNLTKNKHFSLSSGVTKTKVLPIKNMLKQG